MPLDRCLSCNQRTAVGEFSSRCTLPKMPSESEATLLDLLLDSWDRNNRILVNLLRALPPGALTYRALPDSPTVSELFTHMHFVRLILLSEDAPDLAIEVPQREWVKELDVNRLAEELDRSAAAVRKAVRTLIASGSQTKMHYDHPLLFLQHMIWHEGYHHGQIKLALKAGGQAFDDEVIGPITWDVWMDKINTHFERLWRQGSMLLKSPLGR
jgi:uncharacterized damage-inducible protein DinB